MGKRLFGLLFLGAAACSTESPAETSGSDASEDVAADTTVGCTFSCGPSMTPEELDASLEVRVRTRLGGCNGIEGCHVDSVEGLTFPIDDVFADLIGVPSRERPELLRVKPGDPSASYLYLKTLGDGGIEGGVMPLNATSYDPRIAATIFAWIEAGAAHD